MPVMNYYDKDKIKYEQISMLGLGPQIISDAFSPVRDYAEGDYCIKDNTLFKFLSEKPPGEWNPDLVQATNVGEEITPIKYRDVSDSVNLEARVNKTIVIPLSEEESKGFLFVSSIRLASTISGDVCSIVQTNVVGDALYLILVCTTTQPFSYIFRIFYK